MSEVTLSESTLELLRDPVLGRDDVDTQIQYLIEAEYIRRLGRYQRTDDVLTEKYGMSFDEFAAQHVVKQKGYTWEVEKDAMAWEVAIDGIDTMKDRLLNLKVIRREHCG
jgi:hypothetical protein